MRLQRLPSESRDAQEATPQVFLIQDDPQLSRTLRLIVEKCGFDVTIEATGQGALERLGRYGADVVILDLDLPGIVGSDMLLALRERGGLGSVLALTSRTDVESRVAALDAGADDCLVKPFAIAEFVARLRALLRRSSRSSNSRRFGELSLESERRVVWVRTKPVVLSPRENAILQHLVHRGCRFSSRREILSEVLGYHFDPGTNIVEVHIAHLRRKLAGCTTRIESLRGVGYRLRTGLDDDRNVAP